MIDAGRATRLCISARRAAVKAKRKPDLSAEGPFKFGMVGLIHPSKGHLEAIEAISKLDADIQLLIAGTGKTDKLELRINELGLKGKVKLLGFVDDPFGCDHTCG